MPLWPVWDKAGQFGWTAAWRPGKYRWLVDPRPEWACHDEQQAARKKERSDPGLHFEHPWNIDTYSFNMVNGPYAREAVQATSALARSYPVCFQEVIEAI
jgi:hypothetical protein